MDASRITTLTEGQLICLRLVAQHRTSKEIARELGISEDTVDQRITSARRKLGVSSRAEAARILVAAEQSGLYGPPVYPPSVLPPMPETSPKAVVAERDAAPAGDPVEEEREVYQPSVPFSTEPGPRQMLGRRGNDLGPLMRTAVIMAIAAASILITLIAVSTYDTASRILSDSPARSGRQR